MLQLHIPTQSQIQKSHTLADLVITSAHLFLILWLYGVVMHSLTSAMILCSRRIPLRCRKGVVNEGWIIIDEGEALVDSLVFEESQEVGLRSVGMIREVLRGGRIGRKREAEIGVPIRR